MRGALVTLAAHLLFAMSVEAQPVGIPSTSWPDLTIEFDRQQINEQGNWFLAEILGLRPNGDIADGRLGQPEANMEKLRQSRAYSLAVPKTFLDMVRWRPSLVWLPAAFTPGSRNSIADLRESARDRALLNCERFNDDLEKCIRYELIRTVVQLGRDGTLVTEGLAVCNAFVERSPNSATVFDTDCEPIVIGTTNTLYARVVPTSTTPLVVPGFKDNAVVFQYHFRSRDRDIVLSQSRVHEFLDGLAKASGFPPLNLAVSRDDAENVIVGHSPPRYSDELQVREKVRLQLTAKSRTQLVAGSSDELEITVTGRLFITVSNENVPDPKKWREPSRAQSEWYEQRLAESVISAAQAVCDQYALTIGRAAFAYNPGPVVSLKCEHPAP